MFPALWWVAVSRVAELSGEAGGGGGGGGGGAARRPQPPTPATMTAAAAAAASSRRERPAPAPSVQPPASQLDSFRPKPRDGLSWRTGAGAGAGAGAGWARPRRSITRVSKPAGGSMAGSSPTNSSPVTASWRTFSRHSSHQSRCSSARARSRPVRTPSASSAATSANSAQPISFSSLIAHILREISGAQFLHAVPNPRFRGAKRNTFGLGDLTGRHAVNAGHRHGPRLRGRQPAELAAQPGGPVVGDRDPFGGIGHRGEHGGQVVRVHRGRGARTEHVNRQVMRDR